HPDLLHSFPTRRSSDLFKHHENSDLESFPWHAPRQFNPAIDLLTPHYAPNYFGYLNGLPLCPEPTADDFNLVVLCAKASEIDPLDRKSTRLNSSHVKIS